MKQIINKYIRLNHIITYFIFLSLLFIPNISKAQCGQDKIVLWSQSDVDHFKDNYGNCTEIKGNLIVTGEDVTNLDGLHQIKKVNGYLQLYHLQSLTDISGLSSLDSVGGNFIVNDNDLLTNLDGLTSLSWIGGNLSVYANDELLNINGLAALEKVGGILKISINPKLKYLDSLSNLKSIGKDLVIEDNDVLSDITGLRNIDPESIGGKDGLSINGNPKLTFCHLSNFCTYLAKDPATHPRVIFHNWDHCATEQRIIDACNTQPECPLADVQLEYQEDLRRFLRSHPTCTIINGSLILGSDNVTDLSPLHNLITIKKALTINKSNISNLDGLSNITEIGQFLWLQDNMNLMDLSGLSKVKQLTHYLYITKNKSLNNVDGLSGLTEVRGQINIESNDNLTNLNGLSNISSLLGSVEILDNASLTSIEGIKNISPAKIQKVTINNNPLLSICNYPNICSFLNTSYPRDIQGNAASCMNEDSVKVACTMSANYSAGQIPVTVYPNPVVDVLIVSIGMDAANCNFRITDADGKEVYHKDMPVINNNSRIDVSNLPSGFYVLSMALPDGNKGLLKFIKQ